MAAGAASRKGIHRGPRARRAAGTASGGSSGMTLLTGQSVRRQLALKAAHLLSHSLYGTMPARLLGRS